MLLSTKDASLLSPKAPHAKKLIRCSGVLDLHRGAIDHKVGNIIILKSAILYEMLLGYIVLHVLPFFQFWFVSVLPASKYERPLVIGGLARLLRYGVATISRIRF